MRRAVLLMLACCGSALAHTEITRIVPGSGAVVSAPRAVTLDLSEPINLRFSQFWVYAVPAGQTPEQFAATVAPTKGCDAARIDTCPQLTGSAARLRLPLKPHLKAGAYVVVWHILSDDGHPVMGQSSFNVR